MTQPTTPDNEYEWLDEILSIATGSGESIVTFCDPAKAAKQQIISHIQQNYTPNSEVDKLIKNAVVTAEDNRDQEWSKELEAVVIKKRLEDLDFLKDMHETAKSLLDDGSGDLVRVQDLEQRLSDWVRELEQLSNKENK